MKKTIKESEFGFSEIEQLQMQIKSMEKSIQTLLKSVYLQMNRNKISPFFNKDLESSPHLFSHSDPNVATKMSVLKTMEDKVNELYDLLDDLRSK